MFRRHLTLSVLIAAGLFLLSSNLLVASPQSAQTTTSDSAITNAIEAKLFRDPQLKTQDIHVSTQQGVVTLT
ncbi:MAG: BON domain-containing protein, partial [Acidobacteriota bacterium]